MKKMREKELRNKLVEDLEKKGLFSASMGNGTFDIYVFPCNRFVELKKIKDLSRVPKTKENSGIRFTELQSKLLSKMEKTDDFPVVVIEEDNVFYLIPPEKLKQLVREPERVSKKRNIISKGYFAAESLSYEEMLSKLYGMLLR